MGTMARGRARSAFPGKVIFSTTFFILILFPARIFLQRATAPSYGSRPSHFCLSARGALFQRRFVSKTYCHVVSRETFIPKRIVCFLVSKIVCSSRAAVSPLPPHPSPHPCPPPSSPTTLAPSSLPSPSPARTPALESCYRQLVLPSICTNPYVSPVSPFFCIVPGSLVPDAATWDRSRLRPTWTFPRGWHDFARVSISDSLAS